MRTLKLHFPDDALPTLDTFLKQTKEARVFRRAQAVREVVKGHRLQTVSDTFEFIPIKSLAATDSSVPGSCAGHSRVPSPDHGCLASTGVSGLSRYDTA